MRWCKTTCNNIKSITYVRGGGKKLESLKKMGGVRTEYRAIWCVDEKWTAGESEIVLGNCSENLWCERANQVRSLLPTDQWTSQSGVNHVANQPMSKRFRCEPRPAVQSALGSGKWLLQNTGTFKTQDPPLSLVWQQISGGGGRQEETKAGKKKRQRF